MKNTNTPISGKLIELLKTFTESEFRRFELYVYSPYFNKEAAQMKLFRILAKYHPEFKGRSFTKEKIYSGLYPGKRYNDAILRNMLSRTLKLAENFIAASKYAKGDFNYDLNILTGLEEKKQTRLFEKRKAESDTKLINEQYKDGEHYYRKFLLQSEQRRFIIREKSLLKMTNESLFESFEDLSVSFMIRMLWNFSAIANTNRFMLHYSQLKPLMDGIDNQISENYEKYKHITYLLYYYNTYKLASTRDAVFYRNLFELNQNRADELRYSDRKDLFTVLANYCYSRISDGELEYQKEQFLIYKQSIESGFYKTGGGYLSHIYFINTVITGLEAGETIWVREFFGKYSKELDKRNLDNTVLFCTALMHYWNKEYHSAIETAAKVKTEDLSYKHQLKSLFLKIYFDLNEIEPFYSHIDSYRHFIASDNNTGEQTRKAIGNYITFSKKLFDIKINSNEPDFEINRLKTDVIKNKAMINKPWLLRKIEEIEKTI